MDRELNEAEDRILELEMQLRMSRACTAELRVSLEWSVCRLYDTELITASRACELLGCKMLDFRDLYALFPQEAP